MKHAPTFSPGLFDLLKIAIRARGLMRPEKWTRDQIKAHQSSGSCASSSRQTRHSITLHTLNILREDRS